MKTALLQHWMTKSGGAERVLRTLCGMYPDADMFTHAYIPAKAPGFERHRVSESFIARLPFGREHPQAYLPLLPFASRTFGLSAYDLIITSDAGPIRGIRKRKDQRHVCYCHSPMRYIWDLYDEYYRNAGFAGKLAMRLFTPQMRRADLKSAESVDVFVANSRYIAGRIKRIYGRDSEIVYPPCNIEFFSAPIEQANNRTIEQSPYYLVAGRLVGYKRADLALQSCLRMGRKIVILGTGEQEGLLRSLAGKSDLVTFLGRVPDDELRRVYQEARALLFPGLEDFGIVPVEAQAAGTPVIAFGEGGALETVKNGETGLFFREQTEESLCHAIEEFESRDWDRMKCTLNAAQFGQAAFEDGMRAVIAALPKSEYL